MLWGPTRLLPMMPRLAALGGEPATAAAAAAAPPPPTRRAAMLQHRRGARRACFAAEALAFVCDCLLPLAIGAADELRSALCVRREWSAKKTPHTPFPPHTLAAARFFLPCAQIGQERAIRW
jgi:hypothetical protein